MRYKESSINIEGEPARSAGSFVYCGVYPVSRRSTYEAGVHFCKYSNFCAVKRPVILRYSENSSVALDSVITELHEKC